MAYLLAHLIGAPLPRRVGAGADVAVGQNAGVSDGVKRMSFEQFVASPGVLGQIIRNTLHVPPSESISRAIAEQRHCLTLADERYYANHSDPGGHTCPTPSHPHFQSSAAWTIEQSKKPPHVAAPRL